MIYTFGEEKWSKIKLQNFLFHKNFNTKELFKQNSEEKRTILNLDHFVPFFIPLIVKMAKCYMQYKHIVQL